MLFETNSSANHVNTMVFTLNIREASVLDRMQNVSGLGNCGKMIEEDNDRRLFSRYSAANLRAEIDGRLFEVKDISLGGIRLSQLPDSSELALSFFLCPCQSGVLDRRQGVMVQGAVVAHYDDATTALEFKRATMPLMKLVVQQAALELGVEPYAVK
jgi:hypothetical protein